MDVRGTEFYGVFLTKKPPAARVDFFNGSHPSFGRAGDEQLQDCLALACPDFYHVKGVKESEMRFWHTISQQEA